MRQQQMRPESHCDPPRLGMPWPSERFSTPLLARAGPTSATSSPRRCSHPRTGISLWPITCRRRCCWWLSANPMASSATRPSTQRTGEMFLVFVHPAYAGRGVGRTLLAAAHDALRAAGCREAFLFVHEQNTRALAVYTEAGYRPDGSDRISDFRSTRVRELRLVKQL